MTDGVKYATDPTGYQNWQDWAKAIAPLIGAGTNVKNRVEPAPILLSHKGLGGNLGTERATASGLVMYDPALSAPVFANGTTWLQLATEADLAAAILRIKALEDRCDAAGI